MIGWDEISAIGDIYWILELKHQWNDQNVFENRLYVQVSDSVLKIETESDYFVISWIES